jgi:diguanylate cyclase (GGDEF)-like protein
MERMDQLLTDLQDCEAASLVGAHDAGVEIAARALQTARDCGLLPEAALAAAWLAEHQLRRGESEKAAESARAALAEADALELHQVGIKLRNTLTRAWCQLGRADEALPEAMWALGRARSLGAPGLVSRSLSSLAGVVELLGDHPHAVTLLHKADEEAQRDSDKVAQFSAVVNLAGALCRSGRTLAHLPGPLAPTEAQAADLREALAVVQRAKALAQGHVRWEMVCAEIECLSLEALGRLAEMRAAVDRHRALAIQAKAPDARAESELLHADWLLASGRALEACEALDQQVDAVAAQRNEGCRRWWWRSRYRAFKAAGADAQALAALEAMVVQVRRDRELSLNAQARVLLGEVRMEIAQQELAQLRREAQELRERADVATQTSLLDPLTGLANRRALDARLRAVLPMGPGPVEGFSLALIDIDHFKQINDGWGHDVGDTVLCEIALLLTGGVRGGDFVARIGGEEFVVLLWGQALDDASLACERLRQQVQAHDWSRFVPGRQVTVSMGLACAQPLDDAAQLLRRADQWMYAAKREGRNRLQGG